MREACVTRFYAPGDPVDDEIPPFCEAHAARRSDTRIAARYLIESREYTGISRNRVVSLTVYPDICLNNTCFFSLFFFFLTAMMQRFVKHHTFPHILPAGGKKNTTLTKRNVRMSKDVRIPERCLTRNVRWSSSYHAK